MEDRQETAKMASAEYVSTTRAAYDAGAGQYAEWVGSEISAAMEAPIDRSLLADFAMAACDHPYGTVADVGCGPGRAAAFLAARGIDVVAIDVSRAMLLAASVAHPDLPLAQATLTALPFREASLAAVVSWYSIIHTPAEALGSVSIEFRRVLADGGHLLIAFQAGNGEALHRDEAYGQQVSLTSYRHAMPEVEQSLVATGFEVRRRVVREPALPHETTPQAFIVAQADDTKWRASRPAPVQVMPILVGSDPSPRRSPGIRTGISGSRLPRAK